MNVTTEILIQFFVLSLAVYRLTYMMIFEHGTFGMFQKIRDLAGVHMVDETITSPIGTKQVIQTPTANNVVGQILSCFLCCSVWVSMLPAWVLTNQIYSEGGFAEPFGMWVCLTLALSGAAIQWKART